MVKDSKKYRHRALQWPLGRLVFQNGSKFSMKLWRT